MDPVVLEAEEVTIGIDEDKADTSAINKVLLDEDVLCPLARRVPAAKRTGNTLADAAALQQRVQLVQLIDSLSKDPTLVAPLYSHLLLVVRERSLAVGEIQFKCATYMDKSGIGRHFSSRLDCSHRCCTIIRHGGSPKRRRGCNSALAR